MKSAWLLTARNFKRALALSLHREIYTIQLCGHTFRVDYETRSHRQDRDYPLLQRLAQDKNCVFDVGANHGLATLVMSTAISQDSQIYAFEASEETCQVARHNLALNGLSSRVQVINALVAEQTGAALEFYWEHTSGGASLIPGYLGHQTPIKKIATALDDFCEIQNLAPDLIKIDIEGAEGRALAGMRKILASSRPVVMIELHSWQGMPLERNAMQIFELLPGLDYQMIYLRTRAPVKDPQVLASRGRCHVLLWPVEQSLPDWLDSFDTSSL
jgi:FkbM family methyltransferase